MNYIIYKYKGEYGKKINIKDLNTLADARFICRWIKTVHPEYILKIWKKTKNEFYLIEEV